MVSQNISDFARHLKFATGWRLSFDGRFLLAVPSAYQPPPCGYKIRLNFNPDLPEEDATQDATHAIQIAADVARAYSKPLKILATLDIYKQSTRKNFPIEGAGKAITLYPGRDAAVFSAMCRQLLQRISRTPLTPAGHPVSDAAISKNLSFRYGAYTQAPTLTGPDGTVLPDRRDIFALPPWVTLPPWIAETLAIEDDPEDEGVVFGKYEVIACLHRTFAGAVYHAIERQTHRQIVIKESRPYILTDGVLATQRLAAEAEVLRRLQDDPELHTPPVLDLFQADAHTILVMQAVMAGTEVAPPLFHWWQRRRAENANTPEALMHVARQLVACLRRIHQAHGLAWIDFTPMNVLVDDRQPASGVRLALIDAEYAIPATAEALCFDRRQLGRSLLWLLSDDDTVLNPHREMRTCDFDGVGSAPMAYQRAVRACFDPEDDVDTIAALLEQ